MMSSTLNDDLSWLGQVVQRMYRPRRILEVERSGRRRVDLVLLHESRQFFGVLSTAGPELSLDYKWSALGNI